MDIDEKRKAFMESDVDDYSRLMDMASGLLYRSGLTDYESDVHDEAVIQLDGAINETKERLLNYLKQKLK